MGWLKKYTFREPILAWTFYWVGAGLAIPIGLSYYLERNRENVPKHPPTLKEMIDAVKSKNSANAAPEP